MNKTITIRNETVSDYIRVEEITRKAFWNLYIPGCVEHYLVHVMRSHEDFLPELDLVIELDHQVIGNIMYFCKTKLWLHRSRWWYIGTGRGRFAAI